ncbi:hypothetical protein QR680_010636 [Steinernema hermaphroditum]|uniref:Uncharacterized protein n=1 Tax=Steinernema hermaphroditum TaxID=289476 RepID=A0AA39MC48_9BILA|nr:hypothetical protein QR680_010636 [Steinernema hermaphroditum]
MPFHSYIPHWTSIISKLDYEDMNSLPYAFYDHLGVLLHVDELCTIANSTLKAHALALTASVHRQRWKMLSVTVKRDMRHLDKWFACFSSKGKYLSWKQVRKMDLQYLMFEKITLKYEDVAYWERTYAVTESDLLTIIKICCWRTVKMPSLSAVHFNPEQFLCNALEDVNFAKIELLSTTMSNNEQLLLSQVRHHKLKEVIIHACSNSSLLLLIRQPQLERVTIYDLRDADIGTVQCCFEQFKNNRNIQFYITGYGNFVDEEITNILGVQPNTGTWEVKNRTTFVFSKYEDRTFDILIRNW